MSDEEQVRAVIGDYFDGLYFGDMEKFGGAFHPACRLFSVSGDEVITFDYEPYMARCAGRAAPATQNAPRIDEIVSLTVSSADTAHARVRDSFPPRTFINELSFVKTSGRWQIVCKVWHAFD